MIDDVMAGILVAPAIYGPALIGQEFSDGKQKKTNRQSGQIAKPARAYFSGM